MRRRDAAFDATLMQLPDMVPIRRSDAAPHPRRASAWQFVRDLTLPALMQFPDAVLVRPRQNRGRSRQISGG